MNPILWRLIKQVSAIKFLPSINQLGQEHGLKEPAVYLRMSVILIF